MKLSVIIPVYNKEHSVDRAILSILSQGLNQDEYEIMIIDDGSSDGSLSICERYREKYSNIRVFSKENGGVSSARNFGIKNAQGDYICFLDADDFLLPNAFRLILYKFFSDDFDVIEYSSSTITQKTINSQQESFQDATIKCESYGHELLKKEGSCPFSVCMKWIKRSFLIDNNIFFKNYNIAEDVSFNLDLYYANPKIRRTTVDCYRYVTYENDNQASKKRNEESMKKSVDSYMSLFRTISMVNRQFLSDYSLEQCLWPMFNGNLVPFTSRLLCTNMKPTEVQEIYNELIQLQLFPLVNANKQAKICHFIIHNRFLFNFNRFIYSKFFVPYILPNLNRNFNIFTIIDPSKRKS